MGERPEGDIGTLLAALRAPATTAELTAGDWSQLIASARGANLIGLLGERVTSAGVAVPTAARRHLVAAMQLSLRQTRSVRWEVHCLQRALEPLRIPVVLLKGAAYAMSGHPVSRGRLFGDIDILVPHGVIGDVELKLMVAGWTSAKSTPYDQRYYRRWMHELPPMVHVRRGTVLDVHHTILPLTSRRRPDARCLIDAAEALPGLAGIHVPRPEHLLIHSIVHLLHDGELHNGLRDLCDIDGLIGAVRERERERFWPAVIESSCRLDVVEPVHFGLHLARGLIGTAIPASVFEALQTRAGGRPPSTLLEYAYRRALAPRTGDANNALSGPAALAIYLRAHWLRMPPAMLLRHLAHKALAPLKNKKPAVAGRV